MKKTDTDTNMYQTGSTTPPKSHQGLITALLCTVIFLVGIVTALSMMNIRMFQMLQNSVQTPDTVSFVQPESSMTLSARSGHGEFDIDSLDADGQIVDEVFGEYFSLPDGVYITGLETGGAGEKAKLQVGDVVVAVDDVPVSCQDTLEQALEESTTDRRAVITVYRNGAYLQITVVIGE